MDELLQFPEKNRVSLFLKREAFFQKAILVQKHYKLLDQSLEYLQMLYSFPYRDGEVIVLLAEINDTLQQRNVLAELVNAIQCGIPYPMLLIVKCEYVVKFYIHDEEETLINRDEYTNWDPTCSRDILLNALQRADRNFFDKLREDLKIARSATNLCEQWNRTVGDYTESNENSENRSYEDKFFRQSLGWSRELLRREAFLGYTMERGQRFFYNEDDEIRLFSGPALDEQNDWEHRLFLDYCCGHAWSLYQQMENPQVSEEQWLRRYLSACGVYAHGLYSGTLGNSGVRAILAAFREEQMPAPDDDAAGYFSEECLKELMGPNFYPASLYSAPPKTEELP